MLLFLIALIQFLTDTNHDDHCVCLTECGTLSAITLKELLNFNSSVAITGNTEDSEYRTERPLIYDLHERFREGIIQG